MCKRRTWFGGSVKWRHVDLLLGSLEYSSVLLGDLLLGIGDEAEGQQHLFVPLYVGLPLHLVRSQCAFARSEQWRRLLRSAQRVVPSRLLQSGCA